MSNKKYFEIISAKAEFIVKYARVFRLLIIIIYLVCLEILIVNVLTAVDHVPSHEEVKARFLPIKSRNEVINSIESYFLNKEINLTGNLQKGTENNPFVSHKTETFSPTVSPSPSLSPNPQEGSSTSGGTVVPGNVAN